VELARTGDLERLRRIHEAKLVEVRNLEEALKQSVIHGQPAVVEFLLGECGAVAEKYMIIHALTNAVSELESGNNPLPWINIAIYLTKLGP
jgi:hypothetical protein